MTPKTLLLLETSPAQILLLGIDEGGLFLRNIWIAGSGEAKTRSIPVTAQQLDYLATFIKSQSFHEALTAYEQEQVG